MPNGATLIQGDTSSPQGTHQGGELNPAIRNTSESNATDVHAYVDYADGTKIPPLRIGAMSTTGGNHKAEAVEVPGNGGGTGVQIPPGESGTITDALKSDDSNEDEADVTLNDRSRGLG